MHGLDREQPSWRTAGLGLRTPALAGNGGPLWPERALLGLDDSLDYGQVLDRDAARGDARVLCQVPGGGGGRKSARNCPGDGAEEHQVVEVEPGAALRLAQLKLI